MSDAPSTPSRWQEIRRHPAFQAAAVYAGGSWALVQVADIFFPSLMAIRWLGLVLVAGFVVVVGVAWRLAASASAAGAAGGQASSPRKRRRYAYSAALALLILGGVFWWIRPSILGAVAPDAQVIAVLPFNTSGPGVELLGEGMVDLISTNLDAVGAIRTVDSRTVLHRWRQRAIDGSLDLEGALAVGRDVEAGSIVWGSVVAVGAEVRLTAELYSVKGVELARGRAEGPADSLLALVDSLGLDLLRKIWLAREPIPNLRVSGITTGSVDAIRAYLRGQQHYRRSDWDSARVAFGEAVEADSTFALAHFRLGLAYGWSPGYGFGSSIARRHGQLALDYADRLPPRERMLMQAHALFQDGKVEAHDSMKRYVAIYPDDPEGWYELGDVRYHALPLLDLTFDDLVGPFDRVLELDPSLAPAMVHPLELAVAYDDSATFNRYFAKFEAAADSSFVQPYSVGKLYWEDPDSFLIAMANDDRAGARLGGAAMMGSYRSSEKTPDFILSSFRAALQSPDLSDRDRYQMLGMSARILASLGRLEESAQLYDTLWAIDPNGPEASESILGAVIAGIADSSFAARVFSIMASPPPIPGVDQLVQYFQAQYALSRGRSAEARRLVDQALAADTSMFPNLMPHLLSAEQGWADIIDGDTVGGLEKMKAGLNEAGYSPGPQMGYSQALRFALSSALAARPETREEGIRRLRHSYWFGDVLTIPLAYFLLGQALEAEGDAAGAARAYSQFIHLWEKADPALQPRVESARRALQRLSAEDVN